MKSNTIPEMLGTDIRVFVLSDQVCIALYRTDFVTAEKLWAECLVLGSEAHNNMLYVNSSFLFEKYLLGVPLTVQEAFNLYQDAQADPYCKVLGEIYLGLALMNGHQLEQGLQLLKAGMKNAQEVIGDCMDICTAPILVETYLQQGLLSNAVELMEKVMEKSARLKIYGCSGLPDLLRVQAEVFAAQAIHQGNMSEKKALEIENLIRKAHKLSITEESSLIEVCI